jgi:ribosome-associated protein
LATLSVLDKIPTTTGNRITRINRNSKIFKTIIKAIQDKKGENIVSLDLRSIPEASADFFIVCEASSTTQVRAICDFVEAQVFIACSENPYKHEGRITGQWGLIDYVTIVLHVMQPDARKFYKLEEMWSDGGSMMHNEIEKTK